MIKMAAMPIYGKTLKKYQKVDDFDGWYVASGARVLPSLFE